MKGGRFSFIYLKDEANYNSGYELNFYCDDYGYAPDGPVFFAAESKFPLKTFAETKLISAEAAARLGNFINGLNA